MWVGMNANFMDSVINIDNYNSFLKLNLVFIDALWHGIFLTINYFAADWCSSVWFGARVPTCCESPVATYCITQTRW